MSIQTDLSVSPYFDDYNETKDFYKILFRPGVSVQARELNQLQTILQKQIERFGDNIFKAGTIIDGCDIIFNNDFQYVKIKDAETDQTPVEVAKYNGYNVKNSPTNNIIPLVATIVTTTSGYESRSPDLNTLYIKYVNSGFNNVSGNAVEQLKFNPDEVLTVYDPDSVIEKITVNNGAQGFSTSDSVAIVSSIAVQNSTFGTAFANNFVINDYISDGTANCQIIGIDTTSNTEVVILKIKPKSEDLKAGDASKWTFDVGSSVQSIGAIPSSLATVAGIVGTGAKASITLGSLGVIKSINVSQKGSGYYVAPYVGIVSTTAPVQQISLASFTAQNFLTNITIAGAAELPVGSGYAMTVGEGVIYQKGYFSRVAPELVVVEKYSNAPDAVSVGFETNEAIINSNQDVSLLDNATGAPNYAAPGANRLQLTPKLITLTKAEADLREDFLYIAEFSGGEPYKQNRQTVYNKIGEYISQRQYEASGNYVLDQFMLNTKSPSTIASEATEFNAFIDPGVAYINGKRVSTNNNYEISVDKGTDYYVANPATISLNYGNYINVNEYSGNFQFNNGDLVTLHKTAYQYYTSGKVGLVAAAPDTAVGTARIRSVVYDSGTIGSASGVYRIYLFDINLAVGTNFSDIRSIFYDGTNKGIADIVLENGKAVLKDNDTSSLIFYAGNPAVKKANNVSYIRRTADTQTLATTGQMAISLADGTFPYTGTLNSVQEKDIIITPLASFRRGTNLAGTITSVTTSNVINGSSTNFVNQLNAGDFLTSGSNYIGQVSYVANATQLFLSSNAATNITGGTYTLMFPKNVPISFNRSDRTMVVSGSNQLLTVTMNMTTNVEVQAAVSYNVRSTAPAVAKTVNRNKYVRINANTNIAANTGPWALGVPDVFRLNKVYKANANTTYVPTDAIAQDVTQYFYVDHNQNEDFYGISYLVQKPNSGLAIANNDVLLAYFDYFSVTSEGVKVGGASGTYLINDSISLGASASTINTLEIPEVFGNRGAYYDLRDQFDFRPYSSTTATPNTSPSLAPINPLEPTAALRFANTTNKFFPAPDSQLTSTVEYYQGRIDRVVIDETNEFHIIKGQVGTNIEPPQPDNALTINLLSVPPYPSVPYQLSAQTVSFVDTKIANEKYTSKRLDNYRIKTTLSEGDRLITQPRGYTMEQIGKLEKRIKDLEYYTSLTLTEALAQKRVIPSFDGTDRFKFGFFVDGFEDYKYSDVSSPAYRATIVDGYLSPPLEEINIITESPDSTLELPYNEILFTGQTRATDGPVIVTPQVPTVTQTIVSVVQDQRNRANGDNSPYVYEEFFYTFSSLAGPVEFYINSKNNNVAAEFFQSKTFDGPWVSIKSSASADAITDADITSRQLSLNGNRNIEHTGSLERMNYGPVGYFLEDQFKILFTHDPIKGQYYKVRVYKGERHKSFWRGGKEGTFGYKLIYPSDTSINMIVRDPYINYIQSHSNYFGGGYVIPFKNNQNV
jgi:hypothetical protein